MELINRYENRLDVPIAPVPHLSQPQIVALSTKLIQLLKSGSLEERKQVLRGLVAEVRAERVGKHIFALISCYYPPPFDFAPMLPMSLMPMGALLHRQLFSYPAELRQKPRSK